MKPLHLLPAFALAFIAAAAGAAGNDCARPASPDAAAACAEQGFEQAQRRLDDLLRELRGTLNRKDWSYLKESQAYWEKSRSLECHIETAFVAGAPDQDVIKYACLQDHTTDRMHQLRYYLCPRYVRSGQCDAEKAYE